MKRALACAALLAAARAGGACPDVLDAPAWRVRSVRPHNAATAPLVGQPLDAGALAAARRSFDPPPGGRFSLSVTVVYLEHCEAAEADLVFRSFRFRLPYAFSLVPSLDAARQWARGGLDWRHQWAGGRVAVGYMASTATSERLRHGATLELRGGHAELRVRAGPRLVAARALAIGPALWTRPLLPAELRRHPEFETQIGAALASAESLLRLEHYARDPAFRRLVQRLPPGAPACAPGSFRRRLASARSQSGGRQYGLVDALLAIEVPPDCEPALLASLRADLARIDRQSAARRAAAELSEVRRLLDRLLHRTPLIAIRPVAVAQWNNGQPGAGAGARLTLLNWLDATAGYSWRIHRRPQDAWGAPFIEMRFRDPFQ